MARLWVVILCVGVVAIAGCGPPSGRGRFDAEAYASRLDAVRRAGESLDRSAVPDLVEQLRSEDPALRMMAIYALQRVTGTRLGYNPYGTLVERGRAIQSWDQAVREGRFR